MRVAVIFGLGSYENDLEPFQRNSDAIWRIGMPGSAGEADAILVFGGDGTIHRHLASLVKLQLPVLVVPCGSGNDFARGLGLRNVRNSLTAWRKYASGGGNQRSIDLGIIKAPVAGEPQGLKPPPREGGNGGAEALRHRKAIMNARDLREQQYFCCVGGVGLDAEVARRANGLPRWLRGHGGYAVSLPAALFGFAALPMKVSVPSAEGSEGFVVRSEKATVLAAFANAPAYGGGMRVAPRAQMDDGLLDVCVVSDIDKFKLACLFPTVYFGRHLRMPEVEYFQTDRVRIETEGPLDVYADGEYVCKTPIEVGVASRVLRVVV